MKTGWFEGAFYARSPRGLWVKSVVDYEAGEISLWWHTRRKRITSTVFSTIDVNGESCNQLHGWVDAGAIGMDREFLINLTRATSTRARDVHTTVAEHIAQLLVCGFGEQAEDVLDMFVEHVMVPEADYEVTNGLGDLQGLEGTVLTFGEGEYTVSVSGDSSSYIVELPEDLEETVSLMLSTRPIDEERKLSLLSLRGQSSPRGVAPL